MTNLMFEAESIHFLNDPVQGVEEVDGAWVWFAWAEFVHGIDEHQQPLCSLLRIVDNSAALTVHQCQK